MAYRRCLQTLTRRATALFSTNIDYSSNPLLLKTLPSKSSPLSSSIKPVVATWCTQLSNIRHFSSSSRDDDSGDSETDEEIDEEDSDGEGSPVADLGREYSPEEKVAEAAAIGYKVIGPLERSDRVFKDYEPVFAVVQIGSHQFKVSNGDCIYTERLKFCEVNDKLTLNKVLLLGSSTQTIVGRPIVPDAAVHAVVEEHALDAKVIIFKKKRRKNYRRTKGHRQELTKLRITDIQGIEKPEAKVDPKPSKAAKVAVKKPEKVAVAA
ncbi:Ribosomal protein L21 [Tripterygium wilfordii]|uniref:Large ribosomal subunit protein bL21m n=1 Tax=Tripterygium wilfordii TaxID=458696 RepID=A0A7J7C3J3_TRIWF|nr:50S ribosomal protein L21, mitochondrial [Tripterygium wilfordii]KAF5728681.1 Ribosomal protein L21 [Tripterygium wilfordii]